MNAAKVVRVASFTAAAILGLYESTRVTVRLPLAVPVVLIGAVLLVIAVAFRQPPRRAADPPQKAIPAPAPPPPPAWEFDEDSPSEESR
jgi:hypothetical protein